MSSCLVPDLQAYWQVALWQKPRLPLFTQPPPPTRSQVAGRLSTRHHSGLPAPLAILALVLIPVHLPTQLALPVPVGATRLLGYDAPPAATTPPVGAGYAGLCSLILQLFRCVPGRGSLPAGSGPSNRSCPI